MANRASRLTSSGQVTIPATVRRRLALKPGDQVNFTVRGNHAILHKANALDRHFLKLQQSVFDDWNSPHADAAFRSL